MADWCLQSDPVPVPVPVPDSCLQVDAIDLNLGCPQRIAHSGRFGSYLLKDDEHEVVFAMVRALSKALKVPVFCKIRLLETVAKTVAFCARASKLFWSCLSSSPPPPMRARPARRTFIHQVRAAGPHDRSGPAVLVPLILTMVSGVRCVMRMCCSVLTCLA